MPIVTHSEFPLGDMLVRYQAPAPTPTALGLQLVPQRRAGETVTPREHLDAPHIRSLPRRWQPVTAWHVDSLVHVQFQGDTAPAGFAPGRTLRGGPTTLGFRLVRQSCQRTDTSTTIATELSSGRRLTALHELRHVSGESALRVRTTLRNVGTVPVIVDLLTSFSLGGLTPFAADDAPNRLWVHRVRSAWSAEGRPEVSPVEAMNLERSWVGHGVRCERFGQVGSMPTNGFFPFVALEDRVAGVVWAAKIAHPGSWQCEIYRRGDQLCLSGGLADREFGHWWKRLEPGESLVAPEAFVTVVEGDIDEACERLNTPLRAAEAAQLAAERALPIVFNEWCTSWGAPTHDGVVALADRLQGSGVRYLVIDDGWMERPDPGSPGNGDWRVNRAAFPDGLRATADEVRARGLVPGIWFELETVTPGTEAWHEASHQLHRDGVPLQVGSRRFWDFRHAWVHEYLAARVIDFLRANNLGYLKLDYNDTIGVGCDDAESPGEGLRQHLAGVQRFLQRLRSELPDLVIENCSSGAHRAEPSMMALTALTSFSDAHETPDIPVLAANLDRLVCPTQNLIWAVVRPGDSLQRLSYSLAATFLGRMCLSGEIAALAPDAWAFVRDAVRAYHELAPVIARGGFRRSGAFGHSYQHLAGAQAVTCFAPDRARGFVVWHAFDAPPSSLAVALPTAKPWRVARQFSDRAVSVTTSGATLTLRPERAWSGGVIVLE